MENTDNDVRVSRVKKGQIQINLALIHFNLNAVLFTKQT